MCIILVSGNEQHGQAINLTAADSTSQPEETSDAEKSDSRHQMPTSVGSSSTQATSTASNQSYSSEALLSAKECQELISQYFATDKIVPSYYTCSSKLCNSLGYDEITRLRDQKKKYIHTWHQEREIGGFAL